jgi:hypothetical protein
MLERDANADTDDGSGNPLPPDWQPHLTQVCRFWANAAREAVDDSSTVVVVEDVRVIVPTGTDVTEDDRIAQIANRGGTVLDGPLGIRGILQRRDFLELRPRPASPDARPRTPRMARRRADRNAS